MPKQSPTFGYRNFADFSIDLDQLCQNQAAFFNADLLNVIERNFGYSHLSMTAYSQNEFLGVIGTNPLAPLKDYYVGSFFQADPFSKYISVKCNENMGYRPLLFKSTELMSANRYSKDIYFSFLHQFRMSYALTIPINNFRITIFKLDGDADFSSEEVEAIEAVSDMIRSCYRKYLAIRDLYSSHHIKNQLLDIWDTGIIILDDYGRITDLNSSASHFLTESFDSFNITAVVKNLIEMLDAQEKKTPSCAKEGLIYQGYHIKFNTYVAVDAFGIVKSTKYITMIPLKESHVSAQDALEFFRKQGLTAKEIEVIQELNKGKSNKEIAQSLFISSNTVNMHFKNIYRKLNINNQRTLLSLFNRVVDTGII